MGEFFSGFLTGVFWQLDSNFFPFACNLRKDEGEGISVVFLSYGGCFVFFLSNKSLVFFFFFLVSFERP